jgi:hypothetical protein
VPDQLKKAVGSEVVLVQAALYPGAALRARLKPQLLLLYPGPELLLEVVRGPMGRAGQEIVPGGPREASNDTHELAR